LLVGLVLFGFSIGLLARSGLGLPPWDVMHQGLAHQFGLTIGIWSVIVSVLILILWLPLREPFGLGTLLNAIIVGLTVDVTMWLVPETDLAVVAWGMLAAAVALNGVASGMYIGAGMGPGPRDGLMTAIARRGP